MGTFERRICWAPKAPLILAWGSAPGIHGNQRNAPALKARFTSELFRFIIDAMPQSLSKVIVHIIFSTKDREPWLGSDVGPRMHAYLATVCRDLGADLVRIGGVADHVHIVTTLPRTVSQAQLIEQIKKVSSKWIKTLDARYRGFFWQRGYGAFSVSPSQLEAVLEYVDTQQEHHRTRTFQKEYRELLRRHGVDFDERYVWE
jgi:putative transposase